jgi:hypothetical protein
VYESSKDVLRHQSNLEELIGEIFRKFGTQYLVSICRDRSPEVSENARAGNLDASYFHYWNLDQGLGPSRIVLFTFDKSYPFLVETYGNITAMFLTELILYFHSQVLSMKLPWVSTWASNTPTMLFRNSSLPPELV